MHHNRHRSAPLHVPRMVSPLGVGPSGATPRSVAPEASEGSSGNEFTAPSSNAPEASEGSSGNEFTAPSSNALEEHTLSGELEERRTLFFRTRKP